MGCPNSLKSAQNASNGLAIKILYDNLKKYTFKLQSAKIFVDWFGRFAVHTQQTGQKVRKKCSTGRGSFVTKLLLTISIL